MIPVKRTDLQPTTVTLLAKRQKRAATLPAGSKRIQSRWGYFLSHDSAAVDDVRGRLDEMFADTCCYCEAAVAPDIEHFQPKTRYPDRMFAWDNLLRACKNCNFEKSDTDPMDAVGNRWLLDPTQDNPEDHFTWDLTTGEPIYKGWVAGTAHRAEDTLAVTGAIGDTHDEERLIRANEAIYVMDQALNQDVLDEATRTMLKQIFSPTRARRGVLRQIVLDPDNATLVQNVEHKMPELIPHIERLRYRHP